jgi:hypothetical protein
MRETLLERSKQVCEDPSPQTAQPQAITAPVLRKSMTSPAGSGPEARLAVTCGFGEAINAGVVMRNGSGDVAEGADTLVSRAATGSSHSLPAGLRSRFESSLGADLSSVRIHSDGSAAAAASALGARAYATGQDVYMGADEYRPGTADGDFLLAHEVAHTVQQSSVASEPQCKLDISTPGDFSECEADEAAHAMLRGAPFAVTAGAGLARRIQRTGIGQPIQRTAEECTVPAQPGLGGGGGEIQDLPTGSRTPRISAPNPRAVAAWVNAKIRDQLPLHANYDFARSQSWLAFANTIRDGNRDQTSRTMLIREHFGPERHQGGDVPGEIEHDRFTPGIITGSIELRMSETCRARQEGSMVFRRGRTGQIGSESELQTGRRDERADERSGRVHGDVSAGEAAPENAGGPTANATAGFEASRRRTDTHVRTQDQRNVETREDTATNDTAGGMDQDRVEGILYAEIRLQVTPPGEARQIEMGPGLVNIGRITVLEWSHLRSGGAAESHD